MEPRPDTSRRLIERYVAFVIRHRVAVVAGVLVVTALLAAQARHVRLEIRRRAQLPQDHPYVQIQNRVADLFGGETTVVIGVIARGDDVFTPAILSKVVRVTRALEELPGVVQSNLLGIAAKHVKAIRPTAEGMDVRPFIDEAPADPDALRKLRRELIDDPVFGRTLVARDGRATAIVADFDDSLTDTQVRQAVESVIAPERDGSVDFALGGMPLVRAAMADYTREMAILFPIAVVVIGLVHYEAFRTLQAMLLPLATALLSVVWALGITGALRRPMDTWSALTPVVILAVAAGHAVQILKRYYEEYANTGDSAQAVARSVAAVGPVMLTAGFIASVGFGSLVTFGVSSVRVFGMLLALGILSSLIIEMTFVPACRVMLPSPRGREAARESGGQALDGLIRGISGYAVYRPRATAAVVSAIAIMAALGATRVRVDNSFRAWFPPAAPLRSDDRLLNEHLAGTSTLYVLLEGQADGDMEEPEVLRAVGDLQAWLLREPRVGASISLADFVKRMHRVLSEGQPSGDGIPDNKRLIAQYLLLYSLSGPDDFNSVVDPAHRVGVLRAYVKSDEAEFGAGLFRDLEAFAAERFRGLPVQPRIAGGALGVQTALNQVIVREKIVNVTQVSLLIFLLASVALRSLVGGVLVLAPLAFAVVCNLGVMGFSGTWLNLGTATITAMAISIGADFAIYLLFRIREEASRHPGDIAQALYASLLTSGKAIFFVSSAVVLGYLVLMLSGFRLWINVGLLTALMMAVSALATMTIIPVTVVLARPRFLLRAPARRVIPRSGGDVDTAQGKTGVQAAKAVATHKDVA